MNYVGIDHHRQYSHMTLMDEQGNIVRSRRVSNLRSEVKEFLEGVKDCCAVIEAGRSSYTLVDLLDELGVKVTMAHPKEVKSIAKAKVKTDKRDSQMQLIFMPMPESFPRPTAPARGAITARSPRKGIAGSGGRRWKRSGLGFERILICGSSMSD